MGELTLDVTSPVMPASVSKLTSFGKEVRMHFSRSMAELGRWENEEKARVEKKNSPGLKRGGDMSSSMGFFQL